ncbi:MAG: hemerythrin domain-containing protein [Thermodesulfobacteriota bacterium]
MTSVQARGLLMIEHRLIERTIAAMGRMLRDAKAGQGIDPRRLDLVTDFIHTYADRTHHGKEEDILFQELRSRPLTEPDRQLMAELVQEHARSRAVNGQLVAANARHRQGDPAALAEITAGLQTLVDLYPAHIDKEDRQFFPAARACLSPEEDRQLLEAFLRFDQGMIHEKYQTVVAALEEA